MVLLVMPFQSLNQLSKYILKSWESWNFYYHSFIIEFLFVLVLQWAGVHLGWKPGIKSLIILIAWFGSDSFCFPGRERRERRITLLWWFKLCLVTGRQDRQVNLEKSGPKEWLCGCGIIHQPCAIFGSSCRSDPVAIS